MSLYHDPNVPYMRPNLIGDLLTIPAKPSNHQLENQTTTVLAWLVDRSPTIAQCVIELFLGEYAPTPALTRARTQISMPKPTGGALRPDLSICVADHALQLLVEVKVAAGLAVYDDFDGLTQEKVYRALWANPTPGDAHVRAVGTLTHERSTTAPDPDRVIARDVSWRELGDAIGHLLNTGAIAADVALVADSFVAAINDRISPQAISKAECDRFFAEHSDLLDAVRDGVADLVLTSGRAKRVEGKQYFGWRLPIHDVPGTPLFVRLYLAPAGTRLSLAGAPDGLVAAPERNADGLIEKAESAAVEAAGFPKTKDIAGYPMHRDLWPLDRLDPVAVAVEIVTRLHASGLISD